MPVEVSILTTDGATVSATEATGSSEAGKGDTSIFSDEIVSGGAKFDAVSDVWSVPELIINPINIPVTRTKREPRSNRYFLVGFLTRVSFHERFG